MRDSQLSWIYYSKSNIATRSKAFIYHMYNFVPICPKEKKVLCIENATVKF